MSRWKNRTPEQIAEATEDARRAARFKFAEDRIQKMADGLPAFTDEQLTKLAVLLRPETAGE